MPTPRNRRGHPVTTDDLADQARREAVSEIGTAFDNYTEPDFEVYIKQEDDDSATSTQNAHGSK